MSKASSWNPPAKAPPPGASVEDLLARIRIGIRSNNRAEVIAACEQVEKAGVVLDPNMQEMILKFMPSFKPKPKAKPPMSETDVLVAIRTGIANEDRAAVRAVVEAANKEGVKIEPHIKAMLEKWLPGDQAQPPVPPAMQPPAMQPPAVQPPAMQPPAMQPPAMQPPAMQSPTGQPLAMQPPAMQSPVMQSSAIPPPTSEPPRSFRPQ